jgi:ankyrin repeat protein
VDEVLLKYGADPLHPVQQHKRLGTYDSSLMSRAAMSQYPRMIEMLLEHGAPIARTSALHAAAAFGRLETMRVLIKHGADLNEVDYEWNEWTPMHFAASRCQDEAMELLEHSGARSNVNDYEERTPAQLLKEMTLLNARTSQ